MTIENEIQPDEIYRPTPKVVAREIEGELIIVPIEDGFADLNDALFSLNETGAKVWEALGKKQDVQTICTTLADTYDAPVEEISEDVMALLKVLLNQKLIIKA